MVSDSVIHMAGPSVGEVEINFVEDAMRNGWYPPEAYKYVELFEREFADYHQRKFGLMTPNCTTAIHLILEALGVSSGDDVIVPESTWIGSSAGIQHCGANAVFADIDEYTWCLSNETVRKALTPRTKAIIAVDLYGNMPDWSKLEEFAAAHGLPLIEDAAEALGSSFRGIPAGKNGLASVFSFHRTKTLTTGEGGIILTDDEHVFERCRFLRDHGRAPGSYFNTEVAFKYMPSNVQAAIGYGQLTRIDELVGLKRETFLRFKDNLEAYPELQLNLETSDLKNGAWATALVFKSETDLKHETVMEYLEKHQIPSRPFFHPLSSLPAYKSNQTGGQQANPVAYQYSKFGIHLPCSMNMTSDQVDYISEVICQLLVGRAS